MDELIAQITSKVGLDAATAQGATRIIFSFLAKDGDPDKVAALAARIPGSEAYMDQDGDDSSGTLGGLGGMMGGMMGGGAMAALGRLQALGLGMGEIQAVTQTTFEFARAKAGPEAVSDVVASIPGLSQFV